MSRGSSLVPRPGGEAGKLGNRYEGTWTVGVLLDVLADRASSVTVEGIGDEGAGIEFRISHTDGSTEVHSAKRQQADGNWTIPLLTRPSKTGRSILGDLFVLVSDTTSARFVSGTGAFDLEELTDAARASDSLDAFLRRLGERNARFRGWFEGKLTPLFAGDQGQTWHALSRLYVTTINEPTLVADVERRIRSMFRTASGDALDATIVRLLLADIVTDTLGQPIEAEGLRQRLAEHGFLRSPLRDAEDVRQRFAAMNRQYIAGIDGLLINGAQIPRAETADTLQALNDGKWVMLNAPAGEGKSCVVAQTIDQLERDGVPCGVIRLDAVAENITRAEALGRANELPASPVISLGEFAGESTSVLCIDQLDALSLVSGRNQALWSLVDELIDEARSYPHMRVIFACRSFDLEHDPRLKKLVADPTAVTRIGMRVLDTEQVTAALATAKINASALSPRQYEIIVTPLHLYMFIELTDHNASFASKGELFDAYWNSKGHVVDERTGSDGSWLAAVEIACEALSARQTLVLPPFAMDAVQRTTEAMISEAVLHADGGNLRFFHESFFDYAFARTFLRKDQDLVAWLEKDDQALFRRSQVRQVLNFLRDRETERGRYLTTLMGLLTSERVRFHIKRLVLDWLRQVSAPTADEWDVLRALPSDIQTHVSGVVSNSIGWFDTLQGCGQFAQWLAGSPKDADNAVWLLGMPDVQRDRSPAIAALLSPYRGQSEEWRNRLRWLVRRGDAHHSPEMEGLFLALIDDGTLDDATRGFAVNDDWWSIFYQASTEAPLFTVHSLAHWFDRQEVLQNQDDGGDEGQESYSRHSQTSGHVIQGCAQRAPNDFAAAFLPRILALEGRSPQQYLSSPSRHGDPIDQIRAELVSSLAHLAQQAPDELDKLVATLPEHPTKWTSACVLQVWSANPARYAKAIIDFLLADPPRRLKLGYDFSGMRTDSFAAISRSAIAAATQSCDDADFAALAAAILNFTTPWERKARATGRTELALARALDPSRIQEATRRRIQELERKFPEAPERGAPAPPQSDDLSFGFVGSPIPDDRARLMSDGQWISAMRTHTAEWSARRGNESIGGSIELSRVLESIVESDTRRFAALVQQMDGTILPIYFEAILRGLAPNSNGRTLRGSVVEVSSVLRRIRDLGLTVRGEEIARAIQSMAAEEVPEDVIGMLCHMATSDPDPAVDDWELGEHFNGPLQQAINSARGEAAAAFASLLFADSARWEAVKDAVTHLAADRVLAVRAMAAECLVAILDSHREEALALFERLCEGAEGIRGTRFVERFIYYAMFRDYNRARPVLLNMLTSDVPGEQLVAARQLTVAGLWIDEAGNDAAEVLKLGTSARAGAADVFASNIGTPDVADRCDAALRALFIDPSDEVRRAASRCWHSLDPDEVAQRGSLIEAFADSPAFNDPTILLLQLEKTQQRLPVEICRLAERAIEVFGEKAASIQYSEAGDAHHLAKLMVRLHEETDDRATKPRILDAIDGMTRAGFYGLTNELAEFDR